MEIHSIMKSTHIHISFIGIRATLGSLDPKSSTYTKQKQLIQEHNTVQNIWQT